MSSQQPGSQPALQPTFRGYVRTTKDALLLFEACLSGHINHVPRRPHDRERTSLIDSGNVFIYEEQSSGIKRWTDGVTWSPSRILGNFLVYRELEKPFPPGEKKRAMKRGNRPRPASVVRPGEPYMKPSGYSPEHVPAAVAGDGRVTQQTEAERELFGSLVDSYGFKEKGLVKKTMSVTVNKVTHHLVSYYTVQHVLHGDLTTPSTAFPQLRIREELWKNQSFRSPLEEGLEPGMDGMEHQSYHLHREQQLGAAHAYTLQSSAPGAYYGLPAAYPSHPQAQVASHQSPSHSQHHHYPQHQALSASQHQQPPPTHHQQPHHQALAPHHQHQLMQQHHQSSLAAQPPMTHYSSLQHQQGLRQHQPLPIPQYPAAGQQPRVEWGVHNW